MRRRPRRQRSTGFQSAGVGGLFLLVLVAAIALPLAASANRDTVTIKVTDKERGNGKDSRYLIYTSGETFEDSDSILNLKFDSSDVYGQLVRGRTYECEVQGWRIPAISQYRNIIQCEDAS